MKTNALFLVLTLISSSLLQFSAPAYAGSRGISVNLRASEAKDAPVVGTVELYKDSYALVIGNDDYTNGWPKLSNAVKDAKLIAEDLEQRGFEVDLQLNLTSEQLNKVFKRFFILKGDNPAARLFIWYAGHGATVDGEGYLIPTDAPVPSKGAEFKFASVALRDFGTFMRQAVSKHAYAVFDSCFAGTVFSSQRAIPPVAITRATTQPVRQFLTSGDANQTVSDDGAFRELFLRAIDGDERADLNGDGYITASELGMFLGDRVTNLTQSLQTPRYGKLRDKNFDRGDFVFTLPGGATSEAFTPAAGGTVDPEVVFWNSIKGSKSAGEFEAYLKQYPNGSFAALAMVKKNELQRKLKEAQTRTQPKERFRVTFFDTDMQANKVANVRQAPFPTAPRVGRLDKGDKVWVVGQTQTKGGTWYRVARDGVELGFVYSPLLASISREDISLRIVPLPEPEPVTVVTQTEPVAEQQVAEKLATEQAKAEIVSEPAKKKSAIDARLDSMVEDLLDIPEPVKTSTQVQITTQQQDAASASGADTSEIPPEATISPAPVIKYEKNTYNKQEDGTETSTNTSPMASSASEGENSLLVKQQTADQRHAQVQNQENRLLVQRRKSDANVDTTSTKLKDVSSKQQEPVKQTTATSLGTIAAVAEADLPVTRSEAANSSADTTPAESKKAEKVEGAKTETAKVEPTKFEPASVDKTQLESSAVPSNKQVTRMEQQTPPPTQVAMLTKAKPVAEKKPLSEYIKRYIAAAESGNAKAQLSLAYMYETGEQVDKDKSEAVRWYRRAAEQGELQAMMSLGFMYEKGEGVVKDLPESTKWYRSAASLGDADAQQTVGYLYENGIGVTRDPAEAARWYRKAGEQGRVAAQNNLGRLYQLGIGVEKNLDQAIYWYEKAAAQGNKAASKNLAELIPQRY